MLVAHHQDPAAPAPPRRYYHRERYPERCRAPQGQERAVGDGLELTVNEELGETAPADEQCQRSDDRLHPNEGDEEAVQHAGKDAEEERHEDRHGPTIPEVQRDDRGGYRHHRSEEHTSELQSRQYLVCRLL